MSSPVARKSKVRDGHRTSAKRAIAASDEILEQLDPTKVTPQIITKLKHQKQILQGKFDILKQLDEEILGLVDEDQIEEEIQSADWLTEAIQWAMERIEAALADEHPTTSAMSPQPSPQPSTAPKAKLPKLELKKFKGDVGPCMFRPFNFGTNTKIENWKSLIVFPCIDTYAITKNRNIQFVSRRRLFANNQTLNLLFRYFLPM